MKLLFILILLPLGYLVSNSPEADKTSEEYIYELTVNSPGVDSVIFNLFITGYTLSETGARTPLELEKQDLKTPYKLILRNGNYTAIVDNMSKDAVIISRVQGIKNGERMGFGSGEAKRTIIDFGFGGNYLVRKK
ncbi:hypothetical protein ACFS7Z_19705 [Pontibacter toksunensis]|uniref:Uncharacterized protein n=1 Tax=Pontibacter toksunensis TaxID=1332631 RepID=A0ABW6C058_9BACT